MFERMHFVWNYVWFMASVPILPFGSVVVFCGIFAVASSRAGNKNQKTFLFVAGIRLAAPWATARQRVPAAPPWLARESWAR
jgi:hypothetical protein